MPGDEYGEYLADKTKLLLKAREVLTQEEAANLDEFRQRHADQPWLVIPRVYRELSGERVLTLSREDGIALDDVNNRNGFDQDTRNLLGERLFDAIGQQIFEFRAVHCDPHPGNFAFRPDGTIVMYDFGAVKRLPSQDAQLLRDIVTSAIKEEWETLDQQLQRLGARKHDSDVSGDFYATWIELLLRAFSRDPFDFARSQLHTDILKQVKRTSLEQMMKFQPSPRSLLIERVVSGHYWTLMHLGVVAAFRPNLERALQSDPRPEH